MFGYITYGLVVTPTNYGPFNFGGAGNGYALGPQITTSLQIGAGAQNTINIMDSIQAYGNCNSPAVEFCANLSLNGYNDWFLPSGYELPIRVGFSSSISHFIRI